MENLAQLFPARVRDSRFVRAAMSFGRELPKLLQRSVRSFSTSAPRDAQHSYSFVVVGGGAGGLAMASTLSRAFGKGATAVVEPNEVGLCDIRHARQNTSTLQNQQTLF